MTDDLRRRLQDALVPAMRARDRAAVSAIRSALAAVANAEAVPVEPRGGPRRQVSSRSRQSDWVPPKSPDSS